MFTIVNILKGDKRMIQLDEGLVKKEIKEQVQKILKDTNELWL